MLRLLNIEFHKLKHNRASKVLSIIYFGLLTSIALISLIKLPIGDGIPLAEMGIYNFPYIWHFNTYFAAVLKFFLLLVIVSMMANEYSNRTLKQNLIDGLSKKEFILSKFYTVIAFAAISTLFVFVVSLILGLIYSDFDKTSIIFSDLEYLLAFFVKLVGFFSFGLFMGILVKRSAFAVGGLLVWQIFEKIVQGLLFWQIGGTKEGVNIVDNIIRFFPLEAMANLIKEPISRLKEVQSAGKMLGRDFSKDFSVQFTDIAIVSVWTFIFIYLSYRLLKKRDL